MTTAGETVYAKKTPVAAALARDALTKACYARLFDWIVNAHQRSIRGDVDGTSTFIGLLDVYGFESSRSTRSSSSASTSPTRSCSSSS